MATGFLSSPWPPRIGALLFTAFISLFAFEAGDTQQVAQPLDFIMHLLPVGFCVLIIALAWKREWIGAAAFITLALLYAWWAMDHLQWVLLMSGPLLIIAMLYLYAWWMRRRALAATSKEKS